MAARAFETDGEEQTSLVGERLARELRAGDVILLHGELGAGKTAFVRGLARGLGVPAADVSSPTFTLIHEYRAAGGMLFHVDLYRLAAPEVDELGLDELSASGGIMAVEWPERWRDPPAAAYRVTIEHRGGDQRSIAVVPPKN